LSFVCNFGGGFICNKSGDAGPEEAGPDVRLKGSGG